MGIFTSGSVAHCLCDFVALENNNAHQRAEPYVLAIFEFQIMYTLPYKIEV